MAMRLLPLPRLGPIARLSLGLMSLVVSLVLGFDLFFGVLPTRFDTQREVRNALAGALGVHAATLLEQGDREAIERTFAKTLEREKSVVSLALRRSDGRPAVQTAQHEQRWSAPPSGQSTINHVRVPLYADNAPWGALEISFAPLDAYSIRSWLREPLFLLITALGTLGLGLVFLYLRRALEFLDPANAVPERVRQAFDTFVDAVVIVDAKNRIVLANSAFRAFAVDGSQPLYGKQLDQVPFMPSRPTDRVSPWQQAMTTGQPVNGVEAELPRADGGHARMLLGCAPITHPSGAVRGCLVTLHDVTELQQTNEQLRTALQELETSRREVEEKNAELQVLATCDTLTGCLNRRAFSEQATAMLASVRSERRAASCLMVDIDHFKSVNDRFGHVVGDQVIQQVAETLMKQLRNDDLLCRYGGEEFCILMPDVGVRQARAIAERLRHALETNVGRGLSMSEKLVVTASVGIAGAGDENNELEALIDAADAAMYESKRNGRNRVTTAGDVGAAV